MSRLHELERRIDERLRGMLRPSSPGQTREIVEIHRAVLDDVAAHSAVLPGGRRVFPYTKLRLQIEIGDEGQPRAYELAFIEGDAMLRDIRSRLEEEGIELPVELVLEVELPRRLAESSRRGFEVIYENLQEGRTAPEVPELRLAVLTGSAEPQQLCSRKKRIYLGRVGEVLDGAKRVVRRNDIAFHDIAGAPNATVSRSHAHIDYDFDDAVFRLFDDRSTHGTIVIRDAAIIPVPPGTSRGIPLREGDEIVLGQASIRVE